MKVAHVAVVSFTLLSSSFPRAVNGIASATSATTAPRHWTPSSLVMVPIRMSIARLATARSGVPTVMATLAVPVSYKPIC